MTFKNILHEERCRPVSLYNVSENTACFTTI